MPSNSDLLERSVASVIPPDLGEEKVKSGKKLRVYWGIDPTGGKIHLGHTIPMRKLQAFADAGHDAYLVIGSFTAMIGDPSDKDSMRKQLTKEEVEANFESYKAQAEKILDFSKVTVVYNHEWLEKLTLKEVIDLASNFTVQQMTERAMFAERISKNNPVHIHEFTYPLMVGYDSVHLDVDCEIGGTDQEFNMLAGRTLQKAYGKREKFVLTTQLIEGTDGRLMSKTYNNCVYIADPPEEIYGKLMSLEDRLMKTYFSCFTDFNQDEVKEKLTGNPREAKAFLAYEITKSLCGEEGAEKGALHFENVFCKGELPDEIPEAVVKKGSSIIEVLVEQNLSESTSKARKLIEQGGVKFNDSVVDSIEATIEQEGILRVGKRKFLKTLITQP